MAVLPILRLDHEDLGKLAELKGHVRVAAAVALTKTAKDAQGRLKEEAPGIFHLRNSWVVKGIRIEPANAGSLNAKVGTIDKYMGRHVFGDSKPPGHALSIRRSRGSDGRLATGGLLIPSYDSIASAPTHRQERSKLRRIDGQKKKTFQILGKGGSKVLIVRRTGKKRNPLQVLAILSDTVAEHPIWHMDKTVTGTVEAKFGAHFEAALAIGAARSAR